MLSAFLFITTSLSAFQYFIYSIKYTDRVNKILIILPDSLVKQSESIIKTFNILNFSKYVIIKSDISIKHELIIENYNYYNGIKTLFIIDEFDSIYNPLHSNFNIPSVKYKLSDKTKNTMAEYIDKYIIISSYLV